MFEIDCRMEEESLSQGEWQGWGLLRFVLVLFSHRALCNTPFLTRSCQKNKDGDVLMLACQKITAQLFSAKSHTSVAGETLDYTHSAGEGEGEGVISAGEDEA